MRAESKRIIFPLTARQYEAGLLYTIPSFHNPTGTVMSLKRRKELIALARNHRLPVIEDDAYGDIWIDKEPPPPLKSMDGEGNVLYIGTLSKTVSPGLRIGWVVAPESVADRLADIKMQTDYGSSALSQWAACQWLSSGRCEERLLRLRKELKIRRDAALRFLERYAGDIAEWRVPEGAFIFGSPSIKHSPFRRFSSVPWRLSVLINPGALYLPEDLSKACVFPIRTHLYRTWKRHSNDSGHCPPFRLIKDHVTMAPSASANVTACAGEMRHPFSLSSETCR